MSFLDMVNRAKQQQAQAQEDAHDSLKLEVARDLGLDDDLQNPDELSVREAGKIGGNMVKRLIEKGEEKLAEEQSTATPPAQG